MLVGEAAERVVAHGVEKFQLSRMRDKVCWSARELLRDDASHRLELEKGIFVHRMINRLAAGTAGAVVPEWHPIFAARTQMNLSSRTQGADVLAEGGVRYRTWAPGKEVAVIVSGAADGEEREISLGEEPGGYWSAIDSQGQAGDRYKYRFDGHDWPDPASRFNPDGVHGAAQVIDPRDYQWGDDGWIAPQLSELIIYELHIGTFTPAGTFLGAIEKLPHLVDLGVTAIEIMPVADFPGDRNWGYDGVLLYAPARVYGSPNDLRALVDAAHRHGLAVILDVVYNHLGPDGNYLGSYSRDYFNPTHKTPWGDGFNFELQPVRDFFVENTIYWRQEFHHRWLPARCDARHRRRLGETCPGRDRGAGAVVRRFRHGGG